ncbi:MAG: Rieske (2Fe-2S) protein [Cyanobacteria bacterium P01_F01_bin.53]
MKRREFFNWVGLGFLATSLPVAIAACNPATTESADTASADTPEEAAVEIDTSVRDDGFAAVGTVAELDSEGFLADKNFVAGPVIIIRDPADAAGIVALSSTCNHQGCNVNWKETEFVCPCHGSKFGADGSLENGPATAPLEPLEAVIDGDLVLVKA